MRRFYAIKLILLILVATKLSGQEVPMTQVLDSLEKVYSVSFAYNADIVNQLACSYPPKETTMEEALQYIASIGTLDYKIIGAQKVLLRRDSQRLTNPETDLQTLEGRILEIESGMPLPYAAIFSDDLRVGTSTDEEGYFQIAVDPATVSHLNAQYLGYEFQRIPIQNWSGEKKIYLTTQLQYIGPIDVIEAEPGISYFTNTSASLQLSQLAPGPSVGIQDPISRLKLTAGFAGYEDLSSNVSFRGSSADANMFLMDGLPIIDIDHFFGIFSSVQESIVNQIDLYKNNWPVDVGGKTSALVDIQSVYADSLSGSASINNMTAQAHLQFPIESWGNILLSARTTLADISNSGLFSFLYSQPSPIETAEGRTSLLSIEPSFTFSDYYLKGQFALSPKTDVLVNYFRSNDHFTYSHNKNIAIPKERRFIQTKETFNEVSDWSNNAYGLSLKQQWNPLFQSELKLSQSAYTLDEKINLSVNSIFSDRIQVEANNELKNNVAVTQYQFNNEYNGINNISLKLGYQFENIKTSSNIGLEGRNILDNNINTNQHTGYALIEYTLGSLFLSGGSRVTWDVFNEKFLWSPQFNARYLINPNLQIKGALGYRQQTLRQTDYEDRFGRKRSLWILADERRIPRLSSQNVMVGLTQSWSKWSLDIEFYRKSLDGVLEYVLVIPNVPQRREDNDPMNIPPQLRPFAGAGQVIGTDLEIGYQSNRFSTYLSYSLSKAMQTIDELNNGEAYPSQDDRRHQIKLVNSFQWGNWTAYLNYVYASGRPYLDLSVGDFLNSERISIPYRQNLKRLNPYARMDIGMEYEKKWKSNTGLSIGASIFNVLNNENEAYRQNVYAIDQTDRDVIYGNSVQMLDLTPSIYLKFTF